MRKTRSLERFVEAWIGIDDLRFESREGDESSFDALAAVSKAHERTDRVGAA